MQPILSKPSNAAHMAIVYITVGAIMDVWSGIWWWYLRTHNGVDLAFYWCYGFLFTGLVLLVIGFTLGRIGRAARHAELPPESQPGQNTAQPAVTSPPGGAAAVPGGATPAAPGFGGMAAVGAPAAYGQPAAPGAAQPATGNGPGTAGVAPVAPVAPVAGAAPVPPRR